MAGRASRAQTVQYCEVFMVLPLYANSKKVPIKKVLMSREKQKEDDMGKIVKLALAVKDKPQSLKQDTKTLQLISESGFKGYFGEMVFNDKSGTIKKAC